MKTRPLGFKTDSAEKDKNETRVLRPTHQRKIMMGPVTAGETTRL